MLRLATPLLILAAWAGPAIAAPATPQQLAIERATTRTLPGMLDVRFGDGPDAVAAALAKRFRKTEHVYNDFPVFVGEFAGYPDCFIRTIFHRGALVSIWANVNERPGQPIVALFGTITDALTEKYGPPDYRGAYRVIATNPQRVGALGYDAAARDAVPRRRGSFEAMYKFADSNVIKVRSYGDDDGDGFYISIVYERPAAFSPTEWSREF